MISECSGVNIQPIASSSNRNISARLFTWEKGLTLPNRPSSTASSAKHLKEKSALTIESVARGAGPSQKPSNCAVPME